MKKSKLFAFGLLSTLGISLCVGNVFAAWAVTDNADSFAINIRMTMAERIVTFHLPDADDNTCSTYNTTAVAAEYGETLADISVPSTASFLGFTFVNWYQESTFENVFSADTPIESNMDLYAKYTRSNVLYDGSAFFASSNSDQTVNAQLLYKIDNQTWGVTPNTTNAIVIDLISSSGIYKMNYSTNWTIKRKVGVNAHDCSWWGDADADTYVYGLNEDHNHYGSNTYAWGANPSDNHEKVSASTTGTFYIDYSYTYLGALRNNPSDELDLGVANPWTSSKHTHLNPSGENAIHYSKDNIYLYMPSSMDNVPTWGNGNN